MRDANEGGRTHVAFYLQRKHGGAVCKLIDGSVTWFGPNWDRNAVINHHLNGRGIRAMLFLGDRKKEVHSNG